MPDTQTFHSFHAASRVSRLLIRGVIPAIGLVSAAFAVWFGLRLALFIPDDLTAQERAQAIPLLALIGAIVASIPISVGILWYFLDRDFLRTTVTVDVDGISQRKGGSVVRTTWSDVQRVTTFSLGRIQNVTVHHPRGKITFNAGFIDADGPQPRRAIDFRREYLVYPDGAQRRLVISENPLYQVVRARAPESAFGSRK